VNRIDPKKLPGSKWTAVEPKNKEKHFVVSDVQYDERGLVESCEIEAVLTHRVTAIDWEDLKSSNKWLYGWQ
jgi:tryptophan-rich hypothetical protein